MALFCCTFVALKARNLLTVQIHPNEFQLRREKRLFQAYVTMPPFVLGMRAWEQLTDKSASQIIDDGFKHSLIVYEDMQSRGVRLHAAVWEGELRQCPVWTAFGKYSPRFVALARRHSRSSQRVLMTLISHAPVPVPDVAQSPLPPPRLAQGRTALCILQHIPPGKHAAE